MSNQVISTKVCYLNLTFQILKPLKIALFNFNCFSKHCFNVLINNKISLIEFTFILLLGNEGEDNENNGLTVLNIYHNYII